MKLPTTLYWVIGGYPSGLGNASEPVETFDKAFEEALDLMQSNDDAPMFRVLRLDFDADTNLPETTTDVTEDVLAKAVAAYTPDAEYDGWQVFPLWLMSRAPEWAREEQAREYHAGADADAA